MARLKQLKAQLENSRSNSAISAASIPVEHLSSSAVLPSRQAGSLALKQSPACSGLVSSQSRQMASQASPLSSLLSVSQQLPVQQQQTAAGQSLPSHGSFLSHRHGPQAPADAVSAQQIRLPPLSAASFSQSAPWSACLLEPAQPCSADQSHTAIPAFGTSHASAEAGPSAQPPFPSRVTAASDLDWQMHMSSLPLYPVSAGYAEAAVQQMRAGSASANLASARSSLNWPAGSMCPPILASHQQQHQQQHLSSQQTGTLLNANFAGARHIFGPDLADAGTAGRESIDTHCSWDQGADRQALQQLELRSLPSDPSAFVHHLSESHGPAEALPDCSAAIKGPFQDATNLLRPPSFPYGTVAVFPIPKLLVVCQPAVCSFLLIGAHITYCTTKANTKLKNLTANCLQWLQQHLDINQYDYLLFVCSYYIGGWSCTHKITVACLFVLV